MRLASGWLFLACGWFAFGAVAAPVPWTKLSGWQTENHQQALQIFKAACARGLYKKHAAWQAKCAPAIHTKDPQKFFEQHFQAYEIEPNGGLLTGYYTPQIAVAAAPAKGLVPAYGLPQTNAPLPDRATIEKSLQAGWPILGWVDPIELFFAQIQGAVQAKHSDGKTTLWAFAGTNNYPYTALGKVLVQRGLMRAEEVSLASLKAFLRQSADAAALMQTNQRYVFFRALDTGKPITASGLPVVPERTLAVDPAHWFYGQLFWLDFQHPLAPSERKTGLLLASDTGAAIKGRLRADYYWGFGNTAEAASGAKRSTARFVILQPLP